MVGVLKFYCNRDWATRQLNGLVDNALASSPRQIRTATVKDRATKKLSLRVHEEIVSSYRHGMGVMELAKQLGVAKSTIIEHLNRAEVKRRPWALSESQVLEAIQLYKEGLSLAKVGLRLGFNAQTIANALKSRNIKTRDSHGRRQY
jgi:transposase-like protein